MYSRDALSAAQCEFFAFRSDSESLRKRGRSDRSCLVGAVARYRMARWAARLAAPIALPTAVIGGVLLVGLGVVGAGGAPSVGWSPSEFAATDIPPGYLALYRQAADEEGIDWAVLAAVGRVETNHGRSTLPGVHSGTNYAGAMGPMQFLGATWGAYGVDGDGDGRRDVYDPADAIPGAAGYLAASGAPGDYRAALWAYNHSNAYADEVLAWAERYRGAVAVAGSGAGAIAARAALAWLGTPYSWGGGTLAGPSLGFCNQAGCSGLHTVGFDCSGLTRYAWAQAGVVLPRVTYEQWRAGVPVRDPRELQPGDLVFFSDLDHVGLYIGGGRMVNAPATGEVVRIEDIGSGVRAATYVGAIRPTADEVRR